MKRILALIFTLAMVLSCAVFTVSAESGAPASFRLMDGASVRLDASHSGLRFETRILTSELEALGSDVVIGTLIIPTDLKNGDLVVGTPGVMNLSTETEGVKLSVDGEYTVFYAAIVDILPENYARKFSARSYIKIGESYYYTSYSDANNARSVWGVAVDAWENKYQDNAIVKSYLDKVLNLNHALIEKPIKNYTSPYAVSYASNTLTVAKTEGSFSSANELATIIIDGKPYTNGWSLAGGKLTAPYATLVYQNYNSYAGATVTNESAEAQIGTDPGIRMIVKANGLAKATLTSVDGAGKSLGYIKTSWAGKDGVGGVINFTTAAGSLKAPFTTGGHTKLSISMSLMIPEDCEATPQCKFALRSVGADRIQNVFTLQMDRALVLSGGSKAVTVLQKGVFTDITLVFDFATGISYGYCNGELITQGKIPAPPAKYATLLDYMGAHSSVYVFEGMAFCNGTDGTAGICIDNVVVRTY